MGIYVGFDVGGTKCAAVTGVVENGDVRVRAREARKRRWIPCARWPKSWRAMRRSSASAFPPAVL